MRDRVGESGDVPSGELLPSRSVERSGMLARQLLPPGLVQSDHVPGRLLLPQRVGAAAVPGGLCVRHRVCQSGDVPSGELLSERVEGRKGVRRRLLLSLWVHGHAAMPGGPRVQVDRPFQHDALPSGELLPCRSFERGGLLAGNLLPPGLVQP